VWAGGGGVASAIDSTSTFSGKENILLCDCDDLWEINVDIDSEA